MLTSNPRSSGSCPGVPSRAEVRLAAVDRGVAGVPEDGRQRRTTTVRSMPGVGLRPLTFHSGNVSVGVRFVGRLRSSRSVQLVTRWRAAFIPVIRLTRVGEQTAHA